MRKYDVGETRGKLPFFLVKESEELDCSRCNASNVSIVVNDDDDGNGLTMTTLTMTTMVMRMPTTTTDGAVIHSSVL